VWALLNFDYICGFYDMMLQFITLTSDQIVISDPGASHGGSLSGNPSFGDKIHQTINIFIWSTATVVTTGLISIVTIQFWVPDAI
jgi:hypothetical protein